MPRSVISCGKRCHERKRGGQLERPVVLAAVEQVRQIFSDRDTVEIVMTDRPGRYVRRVTL